MSKETSKTNKSLVMVCVVGAIVIVALVCVIVAMMNSKNGVNEAGDAEKKRPVVVTPENAEKMAEQILSNEEETEGVPLSYQVTMNSTWEFEDGKSESTNAYVANSKDNETPVYFDVVRNDTQETIYQSPVIPVGQDLSSITLNQDLDAGDYECTLTYHLIDEEQNTLTTVNMWVMVQIKN